MIRTFIAAVLFAVSLAQPVGAQGLEKGLVAAILGDFATALRQWKPIAEQGDARAQFNLGLMHKNGEGVPQDYGEAVKWFRAAAEQGHDKAQFNLAYMYSEGQGVLQDYVRAHMWGSLAAAQGNKIAAENREAYAQKMTPAQIAEAQKLARECLARKYKNCE